LQVPESPAKLVCDAFARQTFWPGTSQSERVVRDLRKGETWAQWRDLLWRANHDVGRSRQAFFKGCRKCVRDVRRTSIRRRTFTRRERRPHTLKSEDRGSGVGHESYSVHHRRRRTQSNCLRRHTLSRRLGELVDLRLLFGGQDGSWRNCSWRCCARATDEGVILRFCNHR